MWPLLIIPFILAACSSGEPDPVENKPDGGDGNNPDAGTTPVIDPNKKVKLDNFKTQPVEGNLQLLVAGKKGKNCHAVTQTDTKTKVCTVSKTTGKGACVDIPATGGRSYSRGVEFDRNGKTLVALSYQSTAGFMGSADGKAQGVVFANMTDGIVERDFDINALGLTRPEPVMVNNGQFITLANNGSVNQSVTFDRDSAVVMESIDDILTSNLQPQIISLDGIKNARAMSVVGENLYVAGSAPFQGITHMAKLDLVNGGVSNVGVLPDGIGANGVSPVTPSNKILLTGYNGNANEGPMAFFNTNTNTAEIINLGSDVRSGSGDFFFGAALAGENVVGNFGYGPTTHFVWQAADKTVEKSSTSLDGMSVPPQEYSAYSYCSGGAGSGLDTAGNAVSTVLFFDAVTE